MSEFADIAFDAWWEKEGKNKAPTDEVESKWLMLLAFKAGWNALRDGAEIVSEYHVEPDRILHITGDMQFIPDFSSGLVKAVEYDDTGKIKRVELHSPQELLSVLS